MTIDDLGKILLKKYFEYTFRIFPKIINSQSFRILKKVSIIGILKVFLFLSNKILLKIIHINVFNTLEKIYLKSILNTLFPILPKSEWLII